MVRIVQRGANSFLLELTSILKGAKKDNGKVASPESVSIHCKRCFYQNTDHYSVIICLRNTLGYRTAQDTFSLHKSYFYLIRTALLREFQDTFPE